MDWTPDDVITTDKYLAAFPKYHAKTDVIYKKVIKWRHGAEYHCPPSTIPYLITCHSDYSIEDKQSEEEFPDTVWFSVNASAKRVHGLPIGIINNCDDDPSFRISGDAHLLHEIANWPCEPSRLLYMNFSIDTYPIERTYVWSFFESKPWVTKALYSGDIIEARKSYLRDIRDHKFVLCPRGNGVDTHRLWETLYMGRIPIVKRHPIHKDWQDLPILFIDDWNEVTEELLHETYTKFAEREWCYDKLKIGYWLEKLRKSFPTTLVYYTVGYSPTYIDVLALSIQSLRTSGYMGDIAVLCDESFLPRCKELLPSDILFHTFLDSTSPESASMNKLRIFELPGIEMYEKVLFLDSDILVHTNVNALFRRIVSPGKLYVYTETTKHSDHKNIIWSLCSYDDLELEIFRLCSIHVFNAGCFAFVRNDTMKEHFSAIQDMISKHEGPFFYEQSFMNVYFNRNRQTDRSLFTEDNYMFPKDKKAYPGYLLHFAGDPGSGKTKLQRMTEYTRSYLSTGLS